MLTVRRFGNRYFENLNAEQEVPGTALRLSLFPYEISPTSLQAVIVGSTLPRFVIAPIQGAQANTNSSRSMTLMLRKCPQSGTHGFPTFERNPRHRM